MDITAAMVKELMNLTGAGVMACKKALTETDGNQEEAIEVLRKKGEATAVKKAGRIAAEGIVYTAVKDNKAAILPAFFTAVASPFFLNTSIASS